VVDLPADGVLVVDGVFAFRPPIDEHWDLRIWLHVDAELSVRRSRVRDATLYGGADETESLHRDRWLPAERLYIAEVDPAARADIVIDNTDLERPVLSSSCSGPTP
jgi:uridine kinase